MNWTELLRGLTEGKKIICLLQLYLQGTKMTERHLISKQILMVAGLDTQGIVFTGKEF